jgi:hypothetical protein
MAYVGQSHESIFLLPTSGLEATDLYVQYKKQGGILSTKILQEDDIEEFLPGHYKLLWSPDEMSTYGTFFFKVSGPNPEDVYEETFTILLLPTTPIPLPTLCVVTGSIIDLGGSSAPEAAEIIFRVAKYPSKAGESLILGTPIRTIPNAYGEFSIGLIRGKTVIVSSLWAGLKAQFVVPDAPTAKLIDLIPPII